MFYGIKFLFQWVTEECKNFGHVALVDDDIELDVEKIYLQLQKENQESGENLSYQLKFDFQIASVALTYQNFYVISSDIFYWMYQI